jgi:hypothetical protein
MAVTVNVLEVWSEPAPGRVTCFFGGDAESKNVLDMFSFQAMRTELFQWQANTSDTEGCIELYDKCDARPVMAIMDKNCPTLMVLVELNRLGWRPVRYRLTHTDAAVLTFDRRNPHAKRYFQCLLKIQDLLHSNDGEVHSAQPISYYDLLLLGLKATPNMGDAAYRNMLDAIDGPALAEPLPLEAPIDPPLLASLALPEGAEDFDIGGPPALPQEERAAPLALMAGPPAPPCAGSDDSSSSTDADSENSFDIAVGRSDVSGWVAFTLPDGVSTPRFKLDKYKPRGKMEYKRFIIECTHHADCTKKRNCGMTALHGRAEPLGFLLAWNQQGASISVAVHRGRALFVDMELTARWVVTLGDSANILLDRV